MASIARRPDGKWRARFVDPGRHAACGALRPQDRRRTVAVGDGHPGQRRHLRPARCRCRDFARIRRAVATVHDHRPGTSALYERVLRLHVYSVLGHRALASVRHSDARAFVTGLSTSLAPNTARQVHAITRTIFRSAVHGSWRSEPSPCSEPSSSRRPEPACDLIRTCIFTTSAHQYASVLIDGGESVKVVQERLGHASAEETLRTHAHLMPTN